MRHAGAVLILLAGAQAAPAEDFKLAGVWGNKSGCDAALQGAAPEESYFYLKEDEYRENEVSCQFLSAKTARSGAQVARALCGGKGDIWFRYLAIESDDAAKTVQVSDPSKGETLILTACE